MKLIRTVLLLTACLPSLALAQAQRQTPLPEAMVKQGAQLYADNCAKCHDAPTDRIPPKELFVTIRTPEDIIEKLTTGTMRFMAEFMTPEEVKILATTLSTRSFSPPPPDPKANTCAKPFGTLALGKKQWNGWGADVANTRVQPEPGLKAGDVPKLKVKWAFAYPGVAYGQPVIVDGKAFISTRNAQVFALDAASGCTYWSYKGDAQIRTAVTIGPMPGGKFAAYFSDERGTAYAVDATTGALIWKSIVEPHSVVRLIGAPKLHNGVLYVPTSSMEEVSAGASKKYPCCTFRGSVIAVDAVTGKTIWKAYAVQQEPKPTRINSEGKQMFGPAGGAIWNSPTIDEKRGLLYVGTGDSYTDIAADAFNAVVAFDLKTGERKWVNQVMAGDNWIMGCKTSEEPVGNCPRIVGPDLDFGSSPILKTMPGGKQILLAVAKSGIAFAFDPDANGKKLWEVKLGEGGGGTVIWGPAADDEHLYVAIADSNPRQPGRVAGGLTALKLATGEKAWHTPAPVVACSWGEKGCSRGQPAAISVIPGVVFSGTLDGHMRAYSTKDGKILWDVDTAKTYTAVNGGEAVGGSIDGSPQTIADGVLLVNSGNTTFTTPQPGNALLAFTVDGK